MKVQIPEQEDDEDHGGHKCGKVSPAGGVNGIEGQQRCEEVDQEVVTMVLSLAHDHFIIELLLFDDEDSQPEQEIGEDHHYRAECPQIPVAEDLTAPNRPQNEQRRQSAEDHHQSSQSQPFAFGLCIHLSRSEGHS